MNSEPQQLLEEINKQNTVLNWQQRPQIGYPLSETQFQQIYLLGYSTALNDLQQVVKVLHDKQPS